MKTVLTSIFLLVHFFCMSQNALDEFKIELKQRLQNFEDSIAGKQNFHYINTNFFKELIEFIDENTIKKMFESSDGFFSFTIATHRSDTTIKFLYYYQSLMSDKTTKK